MMSVWMRPAAWSSLAIIRSPRLRSVPVRVRGIDVLSLRATATGAVAQAWVTEARPQARLAVHDARS